MAFPSIAPPTYTTGGETYLPQIRTEFEGNYVQSRPRATRETRRWNLVWINMTHADFALLEAAFVADMGTTFSWTEPVTTTVYTVRYSEDSLRWSHSDLGHRSVQVGIETI